MRKHVNKYQPTPAEREDFDYYWQHLRRNECYQKIAIVDNLLRRSAEWAKSDWKKDESNAGPRIWSEVDIEKQHFLIEYTKPSRFTQSRIYSQRAVIQQMVRVCLLLPELLDPYQFAESEAALRHVTELQPDFFQTPQWQAIKGKTWGLVAAWNQLGPDGSAWRHYYNPPSTYAQKFPPARRDPAKEFGDTLFELERAQESLNNPRLIEWKAKTKGKRLKNK